jgi:extracellular factor (EF) 3-hydroxypalmitic acid methyl ester biosynthesis protein
MDVSENRESMVTFQASDGVDVRATIVRLARHSAVFEVHSPFIPLQLSETLPEFKIMGNGRPVYSGRAVVTNVVHTTTVGLCEVALDEGWRDVNLGRAGQAGWLGEEFQAFMAQWEKVYRIRAELKLVVTDIHSFLTDLRAWLEQLEVGIRSSPSANRVELEREMAGTLNEFIHPALNALFGKFEQVAEGIDEDMQAAHRAFCRKHLHSILLCAPFMHRIYAKPLGYAGDYEMVNMILRDPYEGASLLAKILNVYILSQKPAVAHRNRVKYLAEKLIEETSRVMRSGRRARIFNVGCGPAQEVQNFLQSHIANEAEITLLDMNDETIAHAHCALERAKKAHDRVTSLKMVKNSVHQLVKHSGKPKGQQEFDFIYCAGLFDYINDRVCKALMSYFYTLLAPGGILLATNVDPVNPIRNMMEYIFEWHLIYRDGRQLRSLAPPEVPAELVTVKAETSSNNIFLEVRKPLT